MQILTQSLIFSLQLKNWNKNGEISIFWLIIASQMPWHLKNFQDSLLSSSLFKQSCYHPNLLFFQKMTQGLSSIKVHLTPSWGCVTNRIFIYWKGSNIVKLTPSWGPVTTPHWGCVTTWICISWWGPNHPCTKGKF